MIDKMEHLAFVFPGQGSQYVGMGKTLYEAFDEVRQLFSLADEIANRSLTRLCFEGSMEELTLTLNAQPCIYLVSCAVYTVLLRNGLKPSYVAGHSLGEWSAAMCAGFYDFETGLRLVLRRAELMNSAPKGAMAALIGGSHEQVMALCERVKDKGIIVIANYNSPSQIVISGEVNAVEEAARLARDFGIQRAVMLRVSGGFHSPLMQPVAAHLEEALESAQMQDANIPLVANVTARPVTQASELRRLLAMQLVSPVRWVESIQWLWDSGVKWFVEVGPRKVLSQLILQTLPNANVIQVEDPEGVDEALAKISTTAI
ncbi:MAG: ACP S-malonyltransferase [Armatimonadota bacterium]|nr:ACP S-malonyltransferase [Armatimonadota bacterium]MCX7777635.1 ACP S-malonyltransferase [Armatimonadota bacterium]MDW8025881.1 ACP S-malonyltransferase [Armatimonadota bacterium]